MGLIDVVHAIKETKAYRQEAKDILDKLVISHPECQEEYRDWCENTSRLNAIACVGYIARQFCDLEERDFNSELRRRAYLGTAVACISDDAIDDTNKDPKEMYVLDETSHPQKSQRLFYVFHSGLKTLLPEDFIDKFANLINKCNQAQEMSRKLSSNPDNKTLIEIKDNTGGYPTLLAHRILFPDFPEISEEFTPDYSPESGKMPETKDHAIFNFGAMASRLDDLSDVRKDIKTKKRSLVLQNLTTWKSFQRDVEYTRQGFNLFYPKEKVDSMMGIYYPRLMRLAHLTSLEKAISRYWK